MLKSRGAGIYHEILRELLLNGQIVPGSKNPNSPGYNRASIEITGFQFLLSNPRARWINSTTRPLNIPFCFGLTMYFLSGGKDVASIEYYNPLAVRFSDDGLTIPGSSYGSRIRIDEIFRILQDDPTSRRAVMPIFTNSDYRESKDIPCPVALQFLIRDDRLHCISFFRSQNALTVFPYDLFLFTWIQEFFAMKLNYDVGDYTQITGSMHVYEDELKILRGEIQDPLEPPYEMAQMDKVDTAGFLGLESELRKYGLRELAVPPEFDANWYNPYWQSVFHVLLAFADRRRAGERHLRDLNLIQQVAPHLFLP